MELWIWTNGPHRTNFVACIYVRHASGHISRDRVTTADSINRAVELLTRGEQPVREYLTHPGAGTPPLWSRGCIPG